MALSLKRQENMALERKVKQLMFKGRPISFEQTKSLAEIWSYYQSIRESEPERASSTARRRKSRASGKPTSRGEAQGASA